MCAIVDASVVGEVFGRSRPEAAVKFIDWIQEGRGRLVVGGKLLDELKRTKSAGDFIREMISAGSIRNVSSDRIAARVKDLENKGACRSNDPHVIALAQVSGARLLYSNDRRLNQDFSNETLLNTPKGKVYSTLMGKNFQNSHRNLLGRNDLCGSGQ